MTSFAAGQTTRAHLATLNGWDYLGAVAGYKCAYRCRACGVERTADARNMARALVRCRGCKQASSGRAMPPVAIRSTFAVEPVSGALKTITGDGLGWTDATVTADGLVRSTAHALSVSAQRIAAVIHGQIPDPPNWIKDQAITPILLNFNKRDLRAVNVAAMWAGPEPAQPGKPPKSCWWIDMPHRPQWAAWAATFKREQTIVNGVQILDTLHGKRTRFWMPFLDGGDRRHARFIIDCGVITVNPEAKEEKEMLTREFIQQFFGFDPTTGAFWSTADATRKPIVARWYPDRMVPEGLVEPNPDRHVPLRLRRDKAGIDMRADIAAAIILFGGNACQLRDGNIYSLDGWRRNTSEANMAIQMPEPIRSPSGGLSWRFKFEGSMANQTLMRAVATAAPSQPMFDPSTNRVTLWFAEAHHIDQWVVRHFPNRLSVEGHYARNQRQQRHTLTEAEAIQLRLTPAVQVQQTTDWIL